MAVDQLRASQKAAALVLAMGPAAAARVFEHMSEAEVELVAREVSALGDVPREDLVAILQEFFESMALRRSTVTGGSGPARDLMRAWRGAQGDDVLDRIGINGGEPFVFLRSYPPAQVRAVLENEHPQTVAVVLASLPAKQSAQVLAGFDAQVQHDIAMRVASLGKVEPRVIHRVEQSLQQRLGPPKDAAAADATAGGTRELASMLNVLPKEQAEAILDAIRERDPDLAELIREQMFVFEDITTLDDRAVQEVLRAVDPKTLAMAMKGAPDEVTEVIWRNLSERASTALQEEAELLGPAPKSDVVEAQRAVVKAIRQLADEGTITLSSGGEELV